MRIKKEDITHLCSLEVSLFCSAQQHPHTKKMFSQIKRKVNNESRLTKLQEFSLLETLQRN